MSKHLTIYTHQPWSPSKAGLLSQCTKAFEYRYILKLKGTESGTESKIGTAVHRVQELVLDGLNVLTAIDQTLEETPSLTTGEIESVRSFTSAVVKFKDKFDAFTEAHPIVAIHKEKKLAIDKDFKACDYDSPECFLRGNIDVLIVTQSGYLVIIDHKTGKIRSIDKHAKQLDMYTVLGLANYPEARGAQTAIHYVAYNTRIDWGPTRSRAKAEALLHPYLNSYFTSQVTRLADIKATITPLCNWCNFQTICPDWLAYAKETA